MSMSDPISDMLTRIRNATRAGMTSVDIPGSKMKTDIAKVLKSEGYIKNYKFVRDNKQGILRIYLKYDSRQTPAIIRIERVSKPSRRVYVKSNEIEPCYNGLGIGIISTSRGVMTDSRARNQKVGGEYICKVW